MRRRGRPPGWSALGWPLGGMALALALSDLIGRQLGLGALGGGPEDAPGTPRLALTFDDGPSPGTRELLGLLARRRARATFFLTGERAQRDPGALEAMRAAGHQLESHGLSHRHALTLTPWGEARELGWHPEPQREGRLYRPPYGGHSPFTRLLARRAGVSVSLWSLESRDWWERGGTWLAGELLARLRPGAVVLLHDGPPRTLELLAALLPELERRGWQAVTLAELGQRPIGWRAGWRRLLEMWGRG